VLAFSENLCKSFNKNRTRDNQRVMEERQHKQIILVHPTIRGYFNPLALSRYFTFLC